MESVSRRAFLGAAAIGGAGSLVAGSRVGGALGANSGDGATLVSGKVATPAVGDTIMVRTSSRLVKVRRTEDAHVGRDGVAKLSDFVVGDQVVAEGRWDEGVFVAQDFASLYHTIEATIVGRVDGVLKTSKGDIRLTKASVAARGEQLQAKPLARLSAGDKIAAIGRIDGTTGEYIGLRIGVRTK